MLPAVLHALIALALIVAYVIVRALGDDAQELLWILAGQLGGVGVTKVAGQLGGRGGGA